MEDHAGKSAKVICGELAELQKLLRKAVQQNNDPEAEIAARHFRYLIQKRITGKTSLNGFAGIFARGVI